MARKKKSGGGDEGGGYNYMDTYGDLVTLLLCFFVLLYSFSSVDSQKWQQLVMALSTGGPSVVMDPLDPNSSVIDEASMDEEDEEEEIIDDAEQQAIDEDFDELYRKMQAYIKEHDLVTKVEVEKDDMYIKVKLIDDDLFFKPGKADLADSAFPILDSVGEMILSYEPNIMTIVMEGHADKMPINNATYESNWELSGDRARKVARYMIFESKNKGMIDPSKYSYTAMGEYHPIDTNETPEGRARNRRVEVVITQRVALTTDGETILSGSSSQSEF